MDLYRSLPFLEDFTWSSWYNSQSHGILPLLDPTRLGPGKWLLPSLKCLKGDLLDFFGTYTSRWGRSGETEAQLIKEVERTLSRYFENGGPAVVNFPASEDDYGLEKRKAVMDNEALRKMVEDGSLVLSLL